MSSANSSQISIMNSDDEKSSLSEAFLKNYLQFVAITKSKAVSAILVDYFAKDF